MRTVIGPAGPSTDRSTTDSARSVERERSNAMALLRRENSRITVTGEPAGAPGASSIQA